MGLDAAVIFTGYDVVDNAHFETGARAARAEAQRHRLRLGLPERYFISSARFVPRKNLLLLLEAYARYRALTGLEAVDLVLLGDGPLRAELERSASQFGIRQWVHMPGFRQYDELPFYYGLAQFLVHASSSEQWGLVVNEAMAAGLPVLVSRRCGCAPDLVQEGVNGYTFDPGDPEGLARLMVRLGGDSGEIAALAAGSQRIIVAWSPETFSRGLAQALGTALRKPRRASTASRALMMAAAVLGGDLA